MPRCASAVFSWVSLVRSPLFHAPPCTSTIVGKGPTPRGRYTRASQGVPSNCWYSTSLTSTSNPTVVAIRPVYWHGAYVSQGRKPGRILDLVRSASLPEKKFLGPWFRSRPLPPPGVWPQHCAASAPATHRRQSQSQ